MIIKNIITYDFLIKKKRIAIFLIAGKKHFMSFLSINPYIFISFHLIQMSITYNLISKL